ncbi:hypothetical protein [Enterobacter kobei]|uniref:hypothetical protein n=1 Tax=Enterobacter kobei TaxID=208224 RepID=UPI0019107DAD|nr:hypothetical protein [Enterobacter kobei]
MNKKIEVLKTAIEEVATKPGIEVIVAMVNAVYEVTEPKPLPTGEYRRYTRRSGTYVRTGRSRSGI